LINELFIKLKSYLEISSFERRGVFFLLFFILTVCVYNFSIRKFPTVDIPLEEDKLQQLLSQLEANENSRSNLDSSFSKSYGSNNAQNKQPKVLQFFDPNEDDFDSLIKKGVPYKAAKNMYNFSQKGGVFRSKADVKKMYSVTDDVYRTLEPFIVLNSTASLPNHTPSLAYAKNGGDKIKKQSISINTATQEELETLKGIGPSYAAKILRYRSFYGGFFNPQQLYEIKGLDSALVISLLPQLFFDLDAIDRLKVNKATVDELAKHPYINYKEANAIVNFREQHGSFNQISEIKELHIFKGKNINRLIPYLDLN
jgi:competence protein ComEA